MKVSHYLSGLTLGLLVGGIIGYRTAMDPRNRVQIRRFFTGVGDKVKDMGERAKEMCGCSCQAEDLIDEGIMELEAILVPDEIMDVPEEKGKKKTKK